MKLASVPAAFRADEMNCNDVGLPHHIKRSVASMLICACPVCA